LPKTKKVTLAVAALISTFVVLLGITIDNFFVMWLGWGIMFLGLEVPALIDRASDDTLSEQVQKGTLSSTTVWNVIWKSLVGTLLIWLFFHLVFGL
jgi:hypothetical protein